MMDGSGQAQLLRTLRYPARRTLLWATLMMTVGPSTSRFGFVLCKATRDVSPLGGEKHTEGYVLQSAHGAVGTVPTTCSGALRSIRSPPREPNCCNFETGASNKPLARRPLRN